MTAYYNEHDPFAAAWLRELIKDGLVAPGDVDDRSIEDVTPNDVASYQQCHFFAGIGGWSYALRLAGWPDDRPVWTGSPPCQPFSAAGKGAGFADERHLWPSYFWLIRQCRPDTIFGEQVSSKAGLAWFDVVSSDLEAAGYSVGPFDLCAPGVGAFHIRQRLYFVADAQGVRGGEGQSDTGWGREGSSAGKGSRTVSNGAGQLADASIERIGQIPAGQRRPGEATADTERCGGPVGVAHADSGKWNGAGQPGAQWRGQSSNVRHPGVAQGDARSAGLEKRPGQPENAGEEQSAVERAGGGGVAYTNGSQRRQGAVGGSDNYSATAERHEGAGGPGERSQTGAGFWAGAEWIICRDGKARPVEPSIQPLAYGVSNRVGTLRGAGNAIVPELAAKFIKAYMEL